MSTPEPVDAVERMHKDLDTMFDLLEALAQRLGDKAKFAKAIHALVDANHLMGQHIMRFKGLRDEFALMQHRCPDLFEKKGPHVIWRPYVVRYDALLWDVFA